jgi:lipopolysaccharide biosynthesis glycosyltransferase
MHLSRVKAALKMKFLNFISWLTILDSDGDMIFCGQLNELAAIKETTQSAAGSECEGT